MIQVPLALLADYANVSREGKINILGVFDQIYAASVPALHPQMQLVLTLLADRGEAKKEHKIKIELIDQDGTPVSVKIEGTFKFDPPKAGDDVRINQTILLNHVVFNKYGDYSFKIIIDNDVKRSIPLKILTQPSSS
jgi:hypothetical protein